jgi:hypothetical protein
LQQPAQDTVASAEAAVSAQQQVVAAEKALADAKAALSAAQAAASGTSTKPASPTTTTPSPTVTPLAPPETVNRVKQAEADFAAARSGITDQTPLDQASQQFNAAAVALEMSWLQKAHGLPVTGTVDKATSAALQGDLLAKGGAAAQQAQASTAAVQQTLKLAGFWTGPVDGNWTTALT